MRLMVPSHRTKGLKCTVQKQARQSTSSTESCCSRAHPRTENHFLGQRAPSVRREMQAIGHNGDSPRRRRSRRPWLSTAAATAACISFVSASPSSASSASAAASPVVLGRDNEWWLERVHLGESFHFDGSHSDFAQQFYRLFLDGKSKDPLDGIVDKTLRDVASARIVSDLSIGVRDQFDIPQLSPMLQRALLWDMGIVKASDGEYTQVRTRCGFRMAELAVSQSQYEKVGCKAQTCSTTTGELYSQSLECNGYQIGNASQCAAERGKSPVHASMWSNGGDEWTFPDTEIARHEWNESTTSYVVYGIHLAGNRNAYGTCVAPSMTVPCIDYAQLSTSGKAAWCTPKHSRLVTQWLRAEYAIAQESKGEGPKNILLIGVSIAASVLLVAVVLWWYVSRYRVRQRRIHFENERKKTLRAMEGTETEEDGGISYFFTDETTRQSTDRLPRGIGRDPQVTAVLGASAGCMTGFDKMTSFRLKTSARSASRGLPASGVSFVDGSFQHHDYDDISTTRGGGGGIVGCGAVFAGSSSPSNSSSYRSSLRDKTPLPIKNDHARLLSSTSGVVSMTRGTTAEHDTAVVVSSTTTYASSTCEPLTPILTSDLLSSPLDVDYSPIVSRSRQSTVSMLASNTPPSRPAGRSSAANPMAELLHDRTVMAKRVPFIDISFSRRLSKGGYGEVWIGRMRDRLVAVKRLISERRADPVELNAFICEIRLMAQFEHRNILSLLGVAWNSPSNLCMMIEYMDNGDLRNLLRTRSPQELHWKEPRRSYAGIGGAGTKATIAIDIACGLRYLHNLNPPVVHRDLKSNNVVLGDNLVAKLCDFGVSRANEGLETMTCGVGTAHWTAPEVLIGDKYTETADVYSFGVVLTELDTHQLPFHDAADKTTGERMETIRILHLVCMGEIAPSLRSSCHSLIRDLAQDCMAFDPMERPTPDAIIRRLRRFLQPDDEWERSTLAISEDTSTGRSRRRLSSGFSLHDHEADEIDLGGGGEEEEGRSTGDGFVANEARTTTIATTRPSQARRSSREFSTGSIVVEESPRDSDYSDSGAIWV